ncbi:Gag polyprotein [Bienertia sinuspersici]
MTTRIEITSPLYLHPSEGTATLNVEKLEGSNNYRSWKRCNNCGKGGHTQDKCWACKVYGKSGHSTDQCWFVKGFPNKGQRQSGDIEGKGKHVPNRNQQGKTINKWYKAKEKALANLCSQGEKEGIRKIVRGVYQLINEPIREVITKLRKSMMSWNGGSLNYGEKLSGNSKLNIPAVVNTGKKKQNIATNLASQAWSCSSGKIQ